MCSMISKIESKLVSLNKTLTLHFVKTKTAKTILLLKITFQQMILIRSRLHIEKKFEYFMLQFSE